MAVAGKGSRKRKTFLARARRAYAWAENHPPRAKTPQQYASGYLGPKAYAAAQLLHTTGEARFNKDFLDVCVWTRKPDAEIERLQPVRPEPGGLGLCQLPPAAVDARVQQAVRRAILAGRHVHPRMPDHGLRVHPPSHGAHQLGNRAPTRITLPVIMWSYKLTGRKAARCRWRR